MKYYVIIICCAVILAGCKAAEQDFDFLSLEQRYAYLVKDPSLHDYISIDHERVALYASPFMKKMNIPESTVYHDERHVFFKLMALGDDDLALRLYREKGGSRYAPRIVHDIETLYREISMEMSARGIQSDLSSNSQPYSGNRIAGCRVALDPGHGAGTFEEAVRERKFVQQTINGKQVRFYEAKLNLDTALILKKKLERHGATVMLTREKPGYAVTPDFDQWRTVMMNDDLKRMVASKDMTAGEARAIAFGSLENQFQFFIREVDNPYRARIINAFRPHVTVSIHYNADAPGRHYYRDMVSGIKRLLGSPGFDPEEMLNRIENHVYETHRAGGNYSMVFVPGSFLAGELSTPRDRLHFMRLLVDTQFDDSITLGSLIVSYFNRLLKLPPVPKDYGAATSIKVDRGVYARNLRLTRLVHGPVCLAEPLLQNDPRESTLLHREDMVVEGIATNSRVARVVQAYERAIMEFCFTRVRIP